MPYLRSFLILAFTSLPAQASYCTDSTSTTSKYSYEFVNEARQRPVVLCVNSAKFYSYELENIAKASATLRILADQVSLYSYEVVNLAKAGKVEYVAGDQKIYSYEIENIAAAGARVEVSASRKDFYSYELVNVARAAKGKGGLSVVFDTSRFYSYEAENLVSAGAEVRILADQVPYYSYEVVSIAQKGNVTYVVGSKSIYSYELENIVKAGAFVELNVSRKEYYGYELVNVAKAKGNRGGLILVLDSSRLADYEIDNIRKAGAQIVVPGL